MSKTNKQRIAEAGARVNRPPIRVRLHQGAKLQSVTTGKYRVQPEDIEIDASLGAYGIWRVRIDGVEYDVEWTDLSALD